MYGPWRDATHALMIHSCQLVFCLDLFYPVFNALTSTTDRSITVTYSPIVKKRVSLSLVATSSRHGLVYVTVISSYELVHWLVIEKRFVLFWLKIAFQIRPPGDSDKLCILPIGFVWATCVKNCWKLKIFVEFAMSVFKMMFELHSCI